MHILTIRETLTYFSGHVHRSKVQAKNDFITRAIGGVDVPFANRDLMIRLKQGNREKDRIDLEDLLRIPLA